MPKYLVKEKSLIGNEIFEAGQTVEYDGLPAENLEPLDDEGRAKHEEYLASNKARIAAMTEQYKDQPSVGDPAIFMAQFSKMLADQQEKQAEQIGNAVAQALAAIFPNGVPVKGTVKLPDASGDPVA